MTSLLSALRNPAMIPGNAPGSESDLRAQIETLTVERDTANERAKRAETAMAMFGSELDALRAKVWAKVKEAQKS